MFKNYECKLHSIDCVLSRDIIKIEDQPVAKIGQEPRLKSPPPIKMNIISIHAKHKKVLNEWKNYRTKACDNLSDAENTQLDKFIVDFAGVLSDLNKYIESIMCPKDEIHKKIKEIEEAKK